MENKDRLDSLINAYEHTADTAFDRSTLSFLKELRDLSASTPMLVTAQVSQPRSASRRLPTPLHLSSRIPIQSIRVVRGVRGIRGVLKKANG